MWNVPSMVLNFCMYKTFVVSKSVTIKMFLKIMESTGDDANNLFHEDLKFLQKWHFWKWHNLCHSQKCHFWNFWKMLLIGFNASNDLQEELKFFKSDTSKNYKSFVPAEVQNQCSTYTIKIAANSYPMKCERNSTLML